MSGYIGRFAPSPTGRLHIGSLLAALASYADARAHGGRWLVRMEDLDPPRETAGAADDILYTLEAFGFEWDGEVAYQSRRHHLYRAALDQLIADKAAYPCFCSRKEWHTRASQGADGFVYDGLCASGAHEKVGVIPAWRLRVPDEIIGFDDRIVGRVGVDLVTFGEQQRGIRSRKLASPQLLPQIHRRRIERHDACHIGGASAPRHHDHVLAGHLPDFEFFAYLHLSNVLIFAKV